jgi:predicted GNAT family acetyltransferase
MVTSGGLTFADKPAERRYEARLGSKIVGFVDYRQSPGRIKLIHTEVDPAAEGRGVLAYLRRDPEYSELVESR